MTDNEGVIDVMDVIGIFRPKSRIWESSTWRRICRYLLPCYDLGKMMGELYFDFAMQMDVYVGLCLLWRLCTTKEKQKALERGECPSNASNAMQKICLLLVRTFHSPIANNQVNAELINEFLVVKSQTKIDFGKFHRIARFVLA